MSQHLFNMFSKYTHSLYLRLCVSQKKIHNIAMQLLIQLFSISQFPDSQGGGFLTYVSFIGMISDVHMWDSVLSPCEIQNYSNELSFTPGNVLNWNALDFQITGRVLLEDKQRIC